jgi:hypothetical protein
MVTPIVMGEISGAGAKERHACVDDGSRRPLYRKLNNAEARLDYLGHLLMENRHGLIVDAEAMIADGFAEHDAATTMLSAGRCPRDKRLRCNGPMLRHDRFLLVHSDHRFIA